MINDYKINGEEFGVWFEIYSHKRKKDYKKVPLGIDYLN